ncbi:MAG: ribonuclease P protein component [bacterium]|nr:ribonuclease P protein component [bacterium]
MKRSGKFFVVYTSTLEVGKTPRTDIVVGINVSKKAVLRNKIKRQTREILMGLGIKTVINLKVVALPLTLEAKFSELKLDLERTLSAL